MATNINKHIGDKTTFWKLLNGDFNKNVLIPTIQRDYTYGSKTEVTDKVLDKMLEDIKNALFEPNNPELSMNFIYGYTQDKINYVPLDGQQRLTTLYLLHYYAALYNSDADFDVLNKFSYATRETTKNYCNCIIKNHDSIIRDLNQKGGNIKAVIEDMPWYIPDFEYDPSIRSMQVVLERIQKKFHDVKNELWEKLTAEKCPVNFYRLDFGPFGLSDDLYVKMNARGKKLTEYEIFKSMFLKHIEVTLNDRELEKETALKLDNSWTDLIWGCFAKDNLKAVDEAYIRVLKLIFRLISGLKGDTEYNEKPNLDLGTIEYCLTNTDDVKFIESFIDLFNNVCTNVKGSYDDNLTSAIRNIIGNDITINTKYINIFIRCIVGFNVTNAELLIVYGQYLAFKRLYENKTDIENTRLNMRHLRNIIENSNDEIRASNMHSLLKGVEIIIKGEMDRNVTYKFNKNQWCEECEKQEHIEYWKRLWKYEEHSILRGALSCFWDNQEPDLSNNEVLEKVINRLEKFSWLFSIINTDSQDNYNEDDALLRAALLTVKDYSQSPKTKPGYLILGNMPSCWRLMFVKSEQRINQKAIIEVMDSIENRGNVRELLEEMISNYINDPEADTTDWRYYMVKYRKYTYESNKYSNRYGYFYVSSVIDNNKPNSLEVAMLQSSQFGTSNRAWYLLPYILYMRNCDKHKLSIGNHAANDEESFVRFSLGHDECSINIWCEGWRIYGMPLSQAEELGIPCEEKFEEGGNYLLCAPDEHDDYIIWAENNIFKKLEVIPNFNLE